MSNPAAAEVAVPPPPPATVAPFLALLRRDLTSGQRGSMVLWARGMACVAAAGTVLLSFLIARDGMTNEIGAGGVVMLLMLLLLVAFGLLPAIAVGSLRREHETGMLDLLLLAGIRPGVLVAGRTASSFLALMSVLLAALPGLALFSYFGRPSLADLGVAAIAMSGHFLAVAAVGVAISACCRSAGQAIAFTLLALVLWTAALAGGPGLGWPCVTTLVLAATFPELAAPGGMPTLVTDTEHVYGLAINLAVALSAWAIAVTGLTRVRAGGDTLAERLLSKPIKLDRSWPLTWLLQRGSAPARPKVQILLAAPLVFWSLAMSAEFQAVVGAFLVALGLLTALALGATSIAPARERRTWGSLASTAMPGPIILADVMRGTVIGSTVPVLGGLALVVVSSARAGGETTGLIAGAVSVLGTWAIAVTAGVCASLMVTTTATALALGAVVLLVEPLLAAGGGLTLGALPASEASFVLGDLAGATSWLSLLGAAVFWAGWLMVRAGVVRWYSVLLALAPAIVVAAIPYWLGGDALLLVTGPMLALSGLGIGAIIRGQRDGSGGPALVGTILLLAFGIGPLLLCFTPDHAMFDGAFGGLAFVFGSTWGTLNQNASDETTLAVVGVHQAIVLIALYVTVRPRLERWLGRAG